MPELTEPSIDLHAAWLDAHLEWGPGRHEDGFGLLSSDDVHSAAGFSAWLARLDGEAFGSTASAGSHQCIYRWIIEGDTVVGGIALRYDDHPLILSLGHIGYGIRPSARRRGLATWAVNRMLKEAHSLGIDRVLLVCKDGNAASVATIERNGGVLEWIERSEKGPPDAAPKALAGQEPLARGQRGCAG